MLGCWNQWKNLARCLGLVVALVTWAASAQCQMTVGDELNLSLSGNVGFGYSGGYGTSGSGHGNGFVGNGNLSGYYHAPGFINFAVNPYYDRNQTTSSSGFVGQDSGFGANIGIFNGSRFPGFVSFGRSWGSGNAYGLPIGSGLFASSSSGKSFQVGWGVLMPNWPTLHVNYSNTNSTSTLLGYPTESTMNNKSLLFNSQYRWAGWNMMGDLGFFSQRAETPDFLQNTNYIASDSSTALTFQAQHALPLNGLVAVTYNRGSSDFDGRGSTTNTFSGSAGMNPIPRLSISGNLRYTDNVFGTLLQEIYGSTLIPIAQGNDSKALTIDGNATFRIFSGLSANGYVVHRKQSFNEEEVSNTAYGAGATYMNSIPFLGYFRFGFTVVDYYNNYQNNNGLGAFYLDGSLNKHFGKWETSVDGAYGQNVTAASSWYTTSSYNYGGNFKRKFTDTVLWYGTYRANRSALTTVEGSNSHGQTVTSGMTLGAYGASASYSTSGGTSVVGPTGLLTPDPLAGLIANNYVLFNAKSFGVSGSAILFRRAIISGGYSNSEGETSALVNSVNSNESYYLRLQYKVRKLSLNAMYRRIDQSVSAINRAPQVVNSYSFEISRWFNVF
jgi:hypothetical protein